MRALKHQVRRLWAPALIFAIVIACGYLVEEDTLPSATWPALGAALAFGVVN